MSRSLAGERIGVLGLARSGLAAARLALARGASVYASDAPAEPDWLPTGTPLVRTTVPGFGPGPVPPSQLTPTPANAEAPLARRPVHGVLTRTVGEAPDQQDCDDRPPRAGGKSFNTA